MADSEARRSCGRGQKVEGQTALVKKRTGPAAAQGRTSPTLLKPRSAYPSSRAVELSTRIRPTPPGRNNDICQRKAPRQRYLYAFQVIFDPASNKPMICVGAEQREKAWHISLRREINDINASSRVLISCSTRALRASVPDSKPQDKKAHPTNGDVAWR
jgi:hypothetical protein